MSTVRLTYDADKHGLAVKEPGHQSMAMGCTYHAPAINEPMSLGGRKQQLAKRRSRARNGRSATRRQFLRSGHPPKRPAWAALTRRALLTSSLEPAPSRGDGRPNRFDDSERPRALEKPINRAKRAGAGKAKNVEAVALLERIKDQHRGHREQTKDRE